MLPIALPRGRRTLAVATVIAAGLLLVGCGGPPRYQFASSSAGDLVFKLPWSWSLLRSGAPVAPDGTVAPAGSWFAVYDADPHPAIGHLNARSVRAPLLLAQTVVVDKATGAAITDDQLRDVVLPVSAAGRAALPLPGVTFRLVVDQPVRASGVHGVHELFSYDFGQGPEVFDQVAVVDASKTRVHVLVLHCTQVCFDADRTAITSAVSSFTVKQP